MVLKNGLTFECSCGNIDIMGNVKRIIEWQEGKQRTPGEVLEFLRDEIDAGCVTHMVVVYRDDKFAAYVSGSEKRDYKKSDILWDATQWMQRFIGD